MARPITDKELDDLKEQLSRMRGDKDRLRLVNTAAESFTWTCEQVKSLVDVQHYGDAKRLTAINLYPQIVDPQNFGSVLASYKFQEDRDEISQALGL